MTRLDVTMKLPSYLSNKKQHPHYSSSINEFFSLPIRFSPLSFADDINMFKSSAIVAYNKPTLNLGRTELIHFRKQLIRMADLPALVFNDVTSEPYSSVN